MAIEQLKEVGYQIADVLGVNALMRYINRRKLIVLCYHSIISDNAPPDPRTNIAVTKSQFEQQLSELRHHMVPVTVDDVVAAYYGGADLPDRPVLITFDDGFKNNLTQAAPLLMQYEMPAVFFVTSGLIGTSGLLWTQEVVERIVAWPESQLELVSLGRQVLPDGMADRIAIAQDIASTCKRLPDETRRAELDGLRKCDLQIDADWKRELYEFMTWTDVKTLHNFGFAVGAHTVDHPILTSVDRTELERQLRASKEEIESQLGCACQCIAYPNGSQLDVSETVFAGARDVGYRLGFTLCPARDNATNDPLATERICVTRDMELSLFRARVAAWR